MDNSINLSLQGPARPNQVIHVLHLGMGWFPDQVGGLNRYLSELVGAFEQWGLGVEAIVLGPVNFSGDELIVAASADDLLPKRLWSYYRSAKGAIRRADLVDSHFALYSVLPVLMGVLSDKPLVVHFQGPWADESRSTDVPISVVVKRTLEKAVYRRAQGLIALSQAFKDILVQRYGVAPWLITVLSPGIQLDKFGKGTVPESRQRLGIPAEAWLTLAVRRLVPRMGLEVLLDAWAVIVASQPNALLVLAGDGESRSVLERKAARLGIENSVRYLGLVPDVELVDWYRAANVSVVPSLELEGFGLVILESLACGTPVIGTDAGGIPEVLRPLDASTVVPAGDARALARRIIDAINGARPLPDSENCRAYAERFQWRNVVAKTLQVYERAANPSSKRKPRVVFLDHCARLSGAEIALQRLLPSLQQIDSHVLLGESGPFADRLRQAGVSVEVMEMPKSARTLHRGQARPAAFPPLAGLGTVWYILRLARRLRHIRPDLVHTNSLKAAIYGGLACRLAGVPCVWHVRDRIAPDYLPRPAVRLIRWLAQWVPNSVIANSATTLATLHLSPAISSVIPSPVVFDPVKVSDEPMANGHPGFTVGMVGRLAPWKGQHVFVDAFAKAFPNGSERALVIGAPLFGEDGYASELRLQAAALGLDGRMIFLGFQDDVFGQMSRCDAVVHASVIPEPFGQVVVEGMAVGLPVVAPNAGGPAEILEDGVTGLLYEPGNADALADAMRRLANDPALRQRLGEAARARARDFAPEIIAQQVLAIYRTILERQPDASHLILS